MKSYMNLSQFLEVYIYNQSPFSLCFFLPWVCQWFLESKSDLGILTLDRRFKIRWLSQFVVPEKILKPTVSAWLNKLRLANDGPSQNQYLAHKSHACARLAATKTEDEALEVLEQLYQSLLKARSQTAKFSQDLVLMVLHRHRFTIPSFRPWVYTYKRLAKPTDSLPLLGLTFRTTNPKGLSLNTNSSTKNSKVVKQ